MYESEYNRFDPESQFMLTCPGNRLPVSTGSPPGDCLRGRSETLLSDSLERTDKANDLTYKLAPTKRMPWQDLTSSSGDLEPPPVLKFTQWEKDVRKCRTGSSGRPRAISWRENLSAEYPSIQARCSCRDTGTLRPPGSHQCVQSAYTSQWRGVQHYAGSTGTRKSDTYFAHKTIFTYSAKQSRDVSPTPSPCFPPGRDVRRVGNLHSPPGNSSTFKTIIK
jgi:hypothetical protein